MIDNIENNLENAKEPVRRPVLLLILCILSGFYISSSIYSTSASLINGPFSEEELEEAMTGYYKAINQLEEAGNEIPESAINIVNTLIDNSIYVNNEVFYANNFFNLFTLLVGAIAVFLLFKMRKIGFHLYLAYSLLPIIGMYILIPMHLISALSIIITVAISAVFALLYGMNLKEMS